MVLSGAGTGLAVLMGYAGGGESSGGEGHRWPVTRRDEAGCPFHPVSNDAVSKVYVHADMH